MLLVRLIEEKIVFPMCPHANHTKKLAGARTAFASGSQYSVAFLTDDNEEPEDEGDRHI